MSRASIRVWLMLGGLSLVDLVWCQSLGLGVSNWLPFAAVSASLFGVAMGCRLSGSRGRIAAMAEWALLWLIFSVSGDLLTYLAAAHGGALYDAAIARLDAALGFDWSKWFAFISSYRPLRWVLSGAYNSLLAQILFSVFWFSRREAEYRGAELLINVTVALLLTTALFIRFPTLGPCVGMPECYDSYLADLVGLRNGNLPSLDVMLLKGVVPFPSFHAVFAVMFTYAHRGLPTLLPAGALNAVMLLSIPSEGGHYLVDVVGGLAVSVIAILMTRVWPVRASALASATSG